MQKEYEYTFTPNELIRHVEHICLISLPGVQ